MNYNKVLIGGRLTRDIELRYGTSGNAIGNGSVAINDVWKNQAGEKMEKTHFIEFKCFGKQAETIAQWFKKGSNIFIEGALDHETWDDKETGKKRSKLTVKVFKFEFLDPKKTEDNPEAAPKQTAPKQAAPQQTLPHPEEGLDVPF